MYQLKPSDFFSLLHTADTYTTYTSTYSLHTYIYIYISRQYKHMDTWKYFSVAQHTGLSLF